MRLSFDVEVHQLASGQRMILDTHRLLIPDVVWMDWMESDEAKPRVWAVDVSSLASGASSVPDVHHGQLDSFCMSVGPSGSSITVSIELVLAALREWCASSSTMPDVSLSFGDA